MSLSSELTLRYGPELKGFGPTLADDLAAGLAALEPVMGAEDLERWVHDGVALASHSLRAWEAAAEYLRASPLVVERLGADGIHRWCEIALRLCGSSSMMAAAYLKATPGALNSISEDELDPWARQGERLCRGNWKSIALAALYFQVSPPLMRSLPLPAMSRLVELVDQLTERSYELANTCLEVAPGIFASLREDDREPFLRFALAVTKASWADARLYFDRGPRLLERIAPGQRSVFLDLSARVTADVGRQGFPLFSDAAEALAKMPEEGHAVLLDFASSLAPRSPTAAMEYLKSAPFVASRLNAAQIERWQQAGQRVLFEERNPEGAEAFFRLESTRSEELLKLLSSRIELSSIASTLRMYAKALCGETVAVMSVEELVDQDIGWVRESSATTEGSAIYLPPFVSTFEEQRDNFQVYKVYTTHQTGRIEFGSFLYRWDEPGEHAPASMVRREAAARSRRAGARQEERAEAITPIQRYFNCFEERLLISGLFTVVEDTRIDAYVSREYGGIRRWLRRLQEWEIERRPQVEVLPLRQAFVENLLRASLGHPGRMRWPAPYRAQLTEAIEALKVVEQPRATVQDSAEVAAAIYDIASAIPNAIAPPVETYEWEDAPEEMYSGAASMPSGANAGQASPEGETPYQNPPQPDFRGDFKPETVQLLARFKEQTEGYEEDGEKTPLTAEQLREMLENSVELSFDGATDESEMDQSISMILENLEQAAKATGDQSQSGTGDNEGDTGDGGGGGDQELDIKWFPYDEWDFRAGDYRPRWTRVGERFAKSDESDFYADTLRRYHGLVMETRKQFELMRPESFKKIKRIEDGDELDLDLALEFIVDRRAGIGPAQRIYNRRNKVERDVAVAFLLDMSASTDEEIEKHRTNDADAADAPNFDGDPRQYFQWLAARRAKSMSEPPKRIIDLEKESTVLIVEALEAIGDSYGIYGFSGYGRENVEFHVVKDLGERLTDTVQRRVGSIEPIRSTRMGPAIRHTIHKLQEFEAKVKILILVSDGRPQDHGYGRDRTEKEYAVHDTKQALNEAKRHGITPFLITVDKEGHDYLKEMCDDIGYEVVDDIESLPRRLPSLYRHLAAM